MRAGFILSEAFTGIRRNVTMTIAMILTTAISLLLLGFGLVLTRVADNTQELYADKLQIRVNLTVEVSGDDPDCRDDICLALSEQMRTMQGGDNPTIDTVTFVSQEQAWQDYQVQFANQPEMLQIGRKEALSAFFRITPVELSQVPEIRETFNKAAGVQSVVDQLALINTIVSFFDRIRLAAIALAGAAGIAAILLIANMVQVAAMSRKNETNIMRLVGASRWRTQLPFMIEAILAAVLGVAVAIGGLFLAKSALLDQLLGDLVSSNVIAPVGTNDIWWAAGLIAPVGVALTALTAYVTLRLYVRK